MPPGRAIVLVTEDYDAVWTTSYPFAEYTKHEWAGAWINTIFRNESKHLSSELILEAIAATRYVALTLNNWGEPPDLGLISMIDPKHIKPIKQRGKELWGYSYRKAGFHDPLLPEGCSDRTKGGLVVVQILPDEMPAPEPPKYFSSDVFLDMELAS
jgi:hypothetical protein